MRCLSLTPLALLLAAGLWACDAGDTSPAPDDVAGDSADLSGPLPDAAPADADTSPGEDLQDEDTDAAVTPEDVSPDGAPDVAEDVREDIHEEVAADIAEDTAPPAPWRSALYPEDWDPEAVDRAEPHLHDFSYAGYRAAEAPLPDLDALAGGRSFDVLDHGATPDGTADATSAIQAAIDAAAAAGGGVVLLPAGLYRVDGTLRVRHSHIVLRGEGPDTSRLHFTRASGMSHSAHLTFADNRREGASLPLAADAPAISRVVHLADASSLQVGDEVALGWTISEAFVADHDMTDTWQAFNGTWQPFFRRRVVAIDLEATPHAVTLDIPTRYPALTRDGASLRVETGLIRECGLVGVGLANAVGWELAWQQSQVHAVSFDGAADCFFHDVASFPSPGAPETGPGAGAHLQSSGLLIRHSRRMTVSASTLANPQHRGTGGNGYLFEVRQSGEILFKDLEAHGGRHNFIQNWGFGTTGCVWLRTRSLGGRAFSSRTAGFSTTGFSEFHHSLAMANLIDSSYTDDGWSASNRNLGGVFWRDPFNLLLGMVFEKV